MKISDQNPWWNTGGLWQDPDLKRVSQANIQYRPKPFSALECRTNSVLSLRGPRRSGKSVTLKLLIADLIETEGWNPKQILWTTAETLRSLDQLEGHLQECLHSQKKIKLLVIDEITAVNEWQRVIKKMRDNGRLQDLTVIVSGSSAYDLKVGAERMAGRRGPVDNPDRVLLPMGFSEFCGQLHNKHLSLESALVAYLRWGGFPFRVEAFISNPKADPQTTGMSVFDDVFFYEVTRRKLDRNIALEILSRLASIGTTSMSYESFAKPLSLSKDTAKKYLDLLGDSFLLGTISSYDTGRNRVAPRKDRKWIWCDGALAHLPLHVRQGEAPTEASLAEWAVGVELMRRYEARLFEGLSAPRNVFTWKSSGGNELDFLVIDRSKKMRIPVEVKWQGATSSWDFRVMQKAFKEGVLVTQKDRFESGLCKALPADEYLSG